MKRYIAFLFAQTINFSMSAAKSQNKSFKERSNLKSVIRCIYIHFFKICANSPLGESSHTFLKNKLFNLGKTKPKYGSVTLCRKPLCRKDFGEMAFWRSGFRQSVVHRKISLEMRMMFTIHQKRFSFLKKKLLFQFSQMERTVPG